MARPSSPVLRTLRLVEPGVLTSCVDVDAVGEGVADAQAGGVQAVGAGVDPHADLGVLDPDVVHGEPVPKLPSMPACRSRVVAVAWRRRRWSGRRCCVLPRCRTGRPCRSCRCSTVYHSPAPRSATPLRLTAVGDVERARREPQALALRLGGRDGAVERRGVVAARRSRWRRRAVTETKPVGHRVRAGGDLLGVDQVDRVVGGGVGGVLLQLDHRAGRRGRRPSRGSRRRSGARCRRDGSLV